VKWLVAALAFQLALVGLVAAPRLSARLTGDEHRLQVRPVDPIDPFRGAYVTLDYGIEDSGGDDGPVWVPLEPDGLGTPTDRRPSGTAMRCRRDGGQVKCGVESFFASQDEAKRLERVLSDGAIAVDPHDGGGRAAIPGIEERP
jgi:uncharacterized membrane-anchored protein